MRSLEEILRIARQNDQANARKVLMRVLQKNPENISAWELLAVVIDEVPKQIDCYRQILRLDPKHQLASDRLQELTNQSKVLASQSMAAESPPDKEFEELSALLEGKDLEHLDEGTLKGLGSRGFYLHQDEQGVLLTRRQYNIDVSEVEERVKEIADSSLPGGSPVLGMLFWPPKREEVQGQLAERETELKGVQISPGEALVDPDRWNDPAFIKEITDKIPDATSGPVPPEERIRCPKCNAAASIHEGKCQHCGTGLK